MSLSAAAAAWLESPASLHPALPAGSFWESAIVSSRRMLFVEFLKSMFAWCMCDRRAPNAGDNLPGCVRDSLKFCAHQITSDQLFPARSEAELKEVPNENRPRGDIRLATPRGPSASTIESLEKALQTVGTFCFVSLSFAFAFLSCSFQKLKGLFKA